MQREKDGTEHVLFNPLDLDPSGKTSISFTDFTLKADRVCIGTQTKGSEINTARIIDVATGKQLGMEYQNIKIAGVGLPMKTMPIYPYVPKKLWQNKNQ